MPRFISGAIEYAFCVALGFPPIMQIIVMIELANAGVQIASRVCLYGDFF